MELLCLASSVKIGGRCVAGVLPSSPSTWIRPIDESRDHGSIAQGRCVVVEADGSRRLLELLDVVDIPIGDAAPQPHQPENYLLERGAWRLIRKASTDEFGTEFRVAWHESSSLLKTTGPRIDAMTARRGLALSLDLVRVNQPNFYFAQRSTNGRPHLRATFQDGHSRVDLAVTDPVMEAEVRSGRARSAQKWLLTVSLGEALPLSGGDLFHYPMIAGCIPLL